MSISYKIGDWIRIRTNKESTSIGSCGCDDCLKKLGGETVGLIIGVKNNYIYIKVPNHISGWKVEESNGKLYEIDSMWVGSNCVNLNIISKMILGVGKKPRCQCRTR